MAIPVAQGQQPLIGLSESIDYAPASGHAAALMSTLNAQLRRL